MPKQPEEAIGPGGFRGYYVHGKFVPDLGQVHAYHRYLATHRVVSTGKKPSDRLQVYRERKYFTAGSDRYFTAIKFEKKSIVRRIALQIDYTIGLFARLLLDRSPSDQASGTFFRVIDTLIDGTHYDHECFIVVDERARYLIPRIVTVEDNGYAILEITYEVIE